MSAILGDGASVHLENVSVENSGEYGVFVSGAKRSTMNNCNVSHSSWSGLILGGGGLMTISGNGSTINHNGTSGDDDDYGLKTLSGSIHLVSPLTIETISTGNEGGKNHGGPGIIKSVDKDGKVLEVVYDGGPDEDDEEDEGEGDY